MSDDIKICVRYAQKPPLSENHPDWYPGWEPDYYYLTAEEVGTNSKGQPKREWATSEDVKSAFDFLEEYEVVEKALPMAQRLGKIVRAGAVLLEGGDFVLEIVVVKVTYEITEIANNPLTVIAAAAL